MCDPMSNRSLASYLMTAATMIWAGTDAVMEVRGFFDECR